MIEKYLSIKKEEGPIEFKEKSSSFISYAYQIKDEQTALDILNKIKKKYHDARHVCYAYRLGKGEEEKIRYSDDGEPSGTAGIQIYNELKGNNLFNVLVVSIRYFGGIKLGMGGLGRAYSKSASLIIKETEKITIENKVKLKINYNFNDTGLIMKIISEHKGNIINQDFNAQGVETIFELPVSKEEKLKSDIKEYSRGKIKALNL